MRKIGISVGVGLGVLLLAAAFFMTGTWEAAAAPDIPGDARVRVAHLSPDAPAVDIWVDGVPAFTGVGFEDVTAYASLPPGNYLVQVEPADAGGSGPFVISETLSLTADGEFTVAAVGELGDMSLEPLVLADDNTLPAPGDAHVRFVHASPDAPAVDITLSDGTPLFTNIAFKESGAYLPVAAGSYDLEVRLAGTMTTVLPLDDVMLAEGTVYTVFATGYAGSTPALNALLVEDAGQSRVRVAHLSPDAPAVDVWVNGAPALENVDFEEVTAYVPLPSDAYFVEVVPAGQAGPVVISATLTLAPNSDYTVAAIGEFGQGTLEPLVLEDNNALPAMGNAHVRFVHASPDAPPVDITLPDGTPIFAGIAYKEIGTYTPVPAGSYDLEVRPTNTTMSVLDLDGISLADQTVYTVFATGYAGGDTPALNAVLVEDAGQARVRVAHMSPDAPNVDVLVDGAVAFPDVTFEEVTAYATLPSDAYFVEVVGAGTSGPVVLSATLTLAPNQDYTVVAVGEAGAGTLEPLVLEDNNAAPAPSNAHVRFVHASPDAPPVDITLPDGTPIFADIAYKEVGAYTPVPAGTYDLEVRVSGTMTTVLDLMDIPLEKGNVYTVFATGYAGEDTPSLNAVLVVDESWAYTFLPVIRQ